MGDDPTTLATDPAPPPAAYCRRCGYSLRGLDSGQCPECGGAFDLADRKTFARRPPRVRLRWWAWRASLLLVLLTLAAAAVPGWYYGQWRAEQRSLDAIRALGGQVIVRPVDYAGPGRLLPARWAFLRERVAYVRMDDLTAAQAAQLDLRPLGRLDSLDLIHCRLGDASLAQIGGMAWLRGLNLHGSPLDDSGPAHPFGCRRLEYLDLRATRLTDAGLAPVARLTSLKWLSLADTAVTDAGLAHVAGLSALEYLDIGGTAVTNAGLARLRGLAALRSVIIGRSRTTEQGWRDLQKAVPKVQFSY